MRITFFGTGAFGQSSLQALAQQHQVTLVVTQPDRPRGRGLHLAPSPIKETALSLGLPVFQPEDINSPEALPQLLQTPSELGVVIAYGQKIGAPVRDLFPNHCINLHASLLPRWRGAAPLNWAILAGDQETGVTIFELVDKMDAGPVILKAATPLRRGETAHDLHDRLARFGVEPLLESISLLADRRAVLTPQDETQITLARKLSRRDSSLDFSRPAEQLANQVHGLWSWPGAQAEFVRTQGKNVTVTLIQVDAYPMNTSGKQPGTLLAPDLVVCGAGTLRLIRLKPAGKPEMGWIDFANGRALQFGPEGDRFAPPVIKT